jgi:hypothetical protein
MLKCDVGKGFRRKCKLKREINKIKNLPFWKALYQNSYFLFCSDALQRNVLYRRHHQRYFFNRYISNV